MGKNEAIKVVRKILTSDDPVLMFPKHALEEMENDNLEQQDVINVLLSGDVRITEEPELKNGTYRYRLKTNRYVVVVAFFKNADGLTVVTVWEIKKAKK